MTWPTAEWLRLARTKGGQNPSGDDSASIFWQSSDLLLTGCFEPFDLFGLFVLVFVRPHVCRIRIVTGNHTTPWDPAGFMTECVSNGKKLVLPPFGDVGAVSEVGLNAVGWGEFAVLEFGHLVYWAFLPSSPVLPPKDLPCRSAPNPGLDSSNNRTDISTKAIIDLVMTTRRSSYKQISFWNAGLA
jgi:hypothetical protein